MYQMMSTKKASSLERPIGVFDSGIGGLSVLRQMVQVMPGANFVYVGDTARMPYGNKSASDVREYCEEITDYLVDEHDVQAVVIACNTATAIAKSTLEKKFDVPIIGVVESGAESAAKQGRRIGVVATSNTVDSSIYSEKIRQLNPQAEVYETAAPTWASIIEHDYTNLDGEVSRDLTSILDHQIDALVLGCTHYEFVPRHIRSVVGSDVNLISPAKATALRVKELVGDSYNEGKGSIELYVNGDIPEFKQKLDKLELLRFLVWRSVVFGQYSLN